MKAPTNALLRGRAKAPLAELEALHLSSASIDCLGNLELCKRLRSLYGEDNYIKDIDGVRVLKRLWRIDLRDNPLRSLVPLTTFAALGFIYLERTQVTFADLVCLRDVHILELRLTENRALCADHADEGERSSYRAKVVALLPYVWTLDGHFVSSRERADATERCDDLVTDLLNHRQNEQDATDALRFGSATNVWGSRILQDDALVQEDALKLLDSIQKQPSRSTEALDLHRLKTIIELHDREALVHNAHCHFAPSKRSLNSETMLRVHANELFSLPRRTRLELTAVLAAHLRFRLPTKLITEALTIVLLGSPVVTTQGLMEDLGNLPLYAITGLLSLLRRQAIDEYDKLRRKNQWSPHDPANTFDMMMWTSMPVIFTSLLGFDWYQERLDDAAFAHRCAFTVSLLSRAGSFPDRIHQVIKTKMDEQRRLEELINIAKTASDALCASGVVIPSELSSDVTSGDTPMIKKQRQRPWKDSSLSTNKSSTLLSSSSMSSLRAPTGADSRPQKLKRPKPGDWLEIQPKQFIKIHTISSDGDYAVASPATDTTATISLRTDHLVRISSSMWRSSDPFVQEQLIDWVEQLPVTTNRSSLGRLHRESESFHRHGASRNQGFPNRNVTTDELTRLDSTRLPPRLHTQPQPVEVFSSTDTLDANYVLTSPLLASIQNACAVRSFQDQRCPPAGLWNPIKAASYRVIPSQNEITEPAESVKPPKPRAISKSIVEPSNNHDDTENLDDWRQLRRDMQALLGITPPTDFKCFLTAVPNTTEEEASPQERPLKLHHSVSEPLITPSRVTVPQTKPKKLSSLSWHHVATKPQLLVSADTLPSPSSLASKPLVDDILIKSHEETKTAASSAQPRPTTPVARPPLRLALCSVTLPTLPPAHTARQSSFSSLDKAS